MTPAPYHPDPRVDQYIDALPDWQQAICHEVRELAHAADAEVQETIKRTVQPYFVLQGNICALLATKDHVNRMRSRRGDRESDSMSRAARTALAATVVFAVSGILSGRLIDEYDGAAGALEWVLRTLVVISAAVALAAAFLLVLGLRRRALEPRGKARRAAVALAVAVEVEDQDAVPVPGQQPRMRGDAESVAPCRAQPPRRPRCARARTSHAAQAARRRQRHGLLGRAEVGVVDGAPGGKMGEVDGEHHRLDDEEGECRGGDDGQRSAERPRLQEDADAALEYLRQRPDVRAGRIGIVGVSLGGEVAVHAVARQPKWRAMVLEGVQGGSPDDMKASEPDPATFVTLAAVYGLSRVLGGLGPSASNQELIERIAPRPLLLLSAGRGTEARANKEYKRHGGLTTEL